MPVPRSVTSLRCRGSRELGVRLAVTDAMLWGRTAHVVLSGIHSAEHSSVSALKLRNYRTAWHSMNPEAHTKTAGKKTSQIARKPRSE